MTEQACAAPGCGASVEPTDNRVRIGGDVYHLECYRGVRRIERMVVFKRGEQKMGRARKGTVRPAR